MGAAVGILVALADGCKDAECVTVAPTDGAGVAGGRRVALGVDEGYDGCTSVGIGTRDGVPDGPAMVGDAVDAAVMLGDGTDSTAATADVCDPGAAIVCVAFDSLGLTRGSATSVGGRARQPAKASATHT